MDLVQLPFDSSLDRYQKQAEELLEAYRSGDPEAIRHLKQRHPRFLDTTIPWLEKDVSDAEVQAAGLEPADAQLTIARWHDFRDWSALAAYVAAVSRRNSLVYQFETAVEAVVNGDAVALHSLLHEHPELVRTRSNRVENHDPPAHQATLLHYIAANRVEGHRQKTPPNAVEVAEILLRSGAEVDAVAHAYGEDCTTMTLLVSSCHPAEAGVQVALVETLLDFGAAIEGWGSRKWGTPLVTALAFGYPKAAEALARRGARLDNVVVAAGLGRFDDARNLLANADTDSRHRALALAAQYGHAEIVRLLLDAGEDPSRYNPEGAHSHSTPLHQAILAGHEATVRLLVERGARLDLKDKVYEGTPLGWAIYREQAEIERYLRAHGATEE